MITRHKKELLFFATACLLLVTLSPTVEAGNASLKTRGGHLFEVYVNGPENASRGILLAHGWWGLNNQIRVWADKFADLGYRVMAVDLYNGKVAATPDKARTYMNSVNQSEADEEFRAVLAALEKPGRKLATMGWSFGGTESFQATMVAPDKVSATVMYYPFGKIIKSGNNLNSLHSPILMIRARVDSPETIEETTRFIQSVKQSGKSISEVTYDARHGFANPEVKHFDRSASEAAWAKVRNFLDRYLK